jgi:hypothetical protein
MEKWKIMGRKLEDQMKLSIRGILSKQMTQGEDKNSVIASFVSDDSGFPLTGMKRAEKSIVEMGTEEFEHICANIPQVWEFVSDTTQGSELLTLKNSGLNHITIGFKDKDNNNPNYELLITRLEELYISSLYLSKR